MRKANFDWVGESEGSFEGRRYKQAVKELEKHAELFNDSGVTSYWAGLRNGEPYFMVTVKKGKLTRPERLLPDRIAGYEVYYIEGEPPALRGTA
jgi:hypothetical protein